MLLRVARHFILLFSFVFLQACTEATPVVTEFEDLSSGGGSYDAVLVSPPTGTNNSTVINSFVTGGSSFTQYQYKVGGSSLDCSDPIGYLGPYGSAVTIFENIMGYTDGLIKLCAIGSDGTNWQSFVRPTIASWIKDTASPTVSLSAVSAATNASPVIFNVTFNEDITGLTPDDFSISNGVATTVSTVTASSYLLQVVPSADGTVVASLLASRVSDTAGNGNVASSVVTALYDTTSPYITNITTATVDGVYPLGTVISFEVAFNETVHVVGGVPSFLLETGAIDTTATYSTGSGTNKLYFSYTVAASDYSADLDTVTASAISLNSATLQDSATNNASLNLLTGSATTGSLSFNKNISVIGTPAFLSISDGPNYDFGTVGVTGQGVKTFTVSNTGGAPASALSGAGLSAPFQYLGGGYPGSGGTCGAVLSAASNCTILVSYNPTVSGPATDTIEINYLDGFNFLIATRDVSGTAANPAMLTISDGPTYNYGTVPLNYPASKVFTVTNSGSLSASSIGEVGLAAPFQFLGGSYPGSGGTCGGVLAGGGTSCTIVIQYTPATIGAFSSDAIELSYNDGVNTVTAIRNIEGTGGPLLLDVQPVYGSSIGDSNTNWNDYIKFDDSGQDEFGQNIDPCNGTENGRYGEIGGCIHSGEKRKVVVTGYSSCAGMAITDSAGAFEWVCKDNTGTAVWYTKGLQASIGLKDLITLGGAWDPISIDVTLGATTIAVSNVVPWWTNPLVNLTSVAVNGSGVRELTASGTIYYTNAPTVQHRGLYINADKIGVVNLSTYVMQYSGTANSWCNAADGGNTGGTVDAMICGNHFSQNLKYIWLEVAMNGFNSAYSKAAIALVNLKHSRLNQIKVYSYDMAATSTGSGALYLAGANGIKVTGLDAYSMPAGITLKSANAGAIKSERNIFENVRLAKVGSPTFNSTILFDEGTSYNFFNNVRISDGANTTTTQNGITIVSGEFNVFNLVNISNLKATSNGVGVYLASDAADNNVFNRVAVSGLTDAAFYVSNGDNNVFNFVTTANATNNSFYFDGAPTSNNLINSLAGLNSSKVIESAVTSGSNNRLMNLGLATLTTTQIVSLQSSGLPLFNFSGFLLRDSTSTCLGNESNLSGSCNGGGVSSTATGSWVSSSIMGRVITNDVTHPFDSLGVLAYLSINDSSRWFSFDSFFRGWGKDIGAFGATSQGNCSSGNCRIWDLTPVTSGNLHNRSLTGTATNSTINTDLLPCVGGTVDTIKVNHTFTNSVTVDFIRNAFERLNDGVGNDNSFCEDNEDCIYAPHIGAYQGVESSGLSAGYCTLPNNIKIYRYNTL